MAIDQIRPLIRVANQIIQFLALLSFVVLNITPVLRSDRGVAFELIDNRGMLPLGIRILKQWSDIHAVQTSRYRQAAQPCKRWIKTG